MRMQDYSRGKPWLQSLTCFCAKEAKNGLKKIQEWPFLSPLASLALLAQKIRGKAMHL